MIEEGPLADWLYRELSPYVDLMVVCHPRRNRLIAVDGDHDDPIDAEKLAQLFRGGYIKPVHHSTRVERQHFKQWVALYHDRVKDTVRILLKIKAIYRSLGIPTVPTRLLKQEDRTDCLALMPDREVCKQIEMMLSGYDAMRQQVMTSRAQLRRFARQYEVVGRFQAVEGIGLIRAATFFVTLDTPWRFKKKKSLFRYMGIGLERWKSGEGPVRLRLTRQANRRLKSMILSAAQTAINQGDNPFSEQYERLVSNGVTSCNARHTVARTMAGILWGIWKNGSVYRPELVGFEG